MERIKINEHDFFWIQDDGILYVKLGSLDVDNKLDDRTAQLYLDAITELSKGTPRPLLIDLRGVKGTFLNTAAHLLSKNFENMSFVISEAYVVNSLSVKLLVQAYKRIYKTKIPYAIFENVSIAKEYSLSYKN